MRKAEENMIGVGPMLHWISCRTCKWLCWVMLTCQNETDVN